MSELAKRLRVLEQRVRPSASDNPDLGEWLIGVADELSALADYADGRVLVKPNESELRAFALVLGMKDAENNEVLRAMQRKEDKRNGRVMPE